MNLERVVIAPEVARALAAHRAVVALETTVVTHGLPVPHGVQVAHGMESAVAQAGAVPATIGLLDGQVRVGLAPDELERLAATPDVPKVELTVPSDFSRTRANFFVPAAPATRIRPSCWRASADTLSAPPKSRICFPPPLIDVSGDPFSR